MTLMNSDRLYFEGMLRTWSPFTRKVISYFHQNPRELPKASPRHPTAPQGSPKSSPRHPKAPQGAPRGPKRHFERRPKATQGAPGRPKGSLKNPRESQVSQKGIPIKRKETQSRPKGSQRRPPHPKEQDVYKKLPINRPSGRYVLYIYIYFDISADSVCELQGSDRDYLLRCLISHN